MVIAATKCVACTQQFSNLINLIWVLKASFYRETLDGTRKKHKIIMAVFIKLSQSKNATKSSFGKWYAQTVHTGEVHTDELARRISENTTFRPGEVKGIIDELVSEMRLALGKSQVVVVDGLGRFRLAVRSEGVANPADFRLKGSIRRVECRFLPAGHHDGGETGNRQTSRVVRTLCEGADVDWFVGCRPGEGQP